MYACAVRTHRIMFVYVWNKYRYVLNAQLLHMALELVHACQLLVNVYVVVCWCTIYARALHFHSFILLPPERAASPPGARAPARVPAARRCWPAAVESAHRAAPPPASPLALPTEEKNKKISTFSNGDGEKKVMYEVEKGVNKTPLNIVLVCLCMMRKGCVCACVSVLSSPARSAIGTAAFVFAAAPRGWRPRPAGASVRIFEFSLRVPPGAGGSSPLAPSPARSVCSKSQQDSEKG